jgi:uncharacterized protein (TIGR02453 family)
MRRDALRRRAGGNAAQEVPLARQAHFDTRLFKFLRDLKNHNERAWFEANKERYQRDVRAPMQAFILDFAPRLARISTHFVADPRPPGGSMFRIYRDTRFSKDKSPFKIMAAAQFRHQSGKDVHAPGFYLHLEPANVFVGAGLWHPDGPTLARVRRTIVAKPQEWKRITGSRALRRLVTFEGESLVRPPRGFDPDHELIDDLKRKDFVVFARLQEKDACAPTFLDTFVKICRTSARYMEFLTRAVGLRW